MANKRFIEEGLQEDLDGNFTTSVYPSFAPPQATKKIKNAASPSSSLTTSPPQTLFSPPEITPRPHHQTLGGHSTINVPTSLLDPLISTSSPLQEPPFNVTGARTASQLSLPPPARNEFLQFPPHNKQTISTTSSASQFPPVFTGTAAYPPPQQYFYPATFSRAPPRERLLSRPQTQISFPQQDSTRSQVPPQQIMHDHNPILQPYQYSNPQFQLLLSPALFNAATWLPPQQKPFYPSPGPCSSLPQPLLLGQEMSRTLHGPTRHVFPTLLQLLPSQPDLAGAVTSSPSSDQQSANYPPTPLPSATTSQREERIEWSINIPPPFPWATDRRATVHSLERLMSKGIDTITGDVHCTMCGKGYELGFNLKDTFLEVRNIMRNYQKQKKVPLAWTSPLPPNCRLCGLMHGAAPVVSEKKRSINWLFLFLGQLLGCLTLSQLNYFIKHNNLNHHQNHTGTNKDSVLYLTYLGLCKQLHPNGSF